jgi:predicted CXXCH cytochrome family protein
LAKKQKRNTPASGAAAQPAIRASAGAKLRRRWGWLAFATGFVIIAVVLGWLHQSKPGKPPPRPLLESTVPAAAAFADEKTCGACHAAQSTAWQRSHHALAMQEVSAQSVAGDFNDTSFTSHGITTRFFRRDGKPFVHADGPDGKPAEHEVKYVFGVKPLQQYLIELPGGRLQALSVAWDTQRKRWFHLYPKERIDHRDELHWSKPSQNWNFMCAECHSTGVKKDYDAAKNTYATRWHQINVGCQACHGPGSAHVAWAQAYAKDGKNPVPGAGAMGVQIDLKAGESRVQIEACARCHARRSVIAPEYEFGKRLMDTHLPALLAEGLYHADGQIRDEVYEYGSFLQSKMAQKGLRCSDCHDAHSGELKAEGNALCVSCHNSHAPAARPGIDTAGLKKLDYDSPAHHFHARGKPGSACVDCHAPRTTYMVVDPRADHSFRIPRPDLTQKLGTPNACNGCHAGKSAQWAAAAIERQRPGYRPPPHYGEALDAGRHGKSGALRLLAAIIEDKQQPAMVRASALDLARRYPGALTGRLFVAALTDADPMVRRAALTGFEAAPPERRAKLIGPMLSDPVRAVRIEAARLLAHEPGTSLAELEASHRANEDRPEGRVGLGNLALARGRSADAEAAFRSAIALDPASVPAIVNLADLLRSTHQEGEAENVLRAGLALRPREPALIEALALSLVRQQRKREALELLAAAARAKDAALRLAYLYALALDDAGRRPEALRVLEAVLPRADGNRDILIALASLSRESGKAEQAASYVKRLAEINPGDPALPGLAAGSENAPAPAPRR